METDPAPKSPRCYRSLVWLVFFSLGFCLLIIVLRTGIGATPYETTDHLGRPMGFNDRFYPEHYRIALGNFHIADLFKVEFFYEWLLIVAHVAGIWLLLAKRVATRLIRWFFLSQAFLFPIGIPAMLMFPFIMAGLLTPGGTDREGFDDLPFIAIATHPVWVAVSLFIVFRLRGTALGFRQILQRLGSAFAEKKDSPVVK